MPSARELLEQVDALMRRNRGGVDSIAPTIIDPHEPAPQDVVSLPVQGAPEPAMTHEAVEEALAPPLLDDIPVLTEVAQVDQEISSRQSGHGHAPATTDGDVPLLTDAVPDVAPSIDEEEALIGGLAAEAFAVIGGPMGGTNAAPSSAQSRISADDPRWSTLAEDVRMQVLQRLDLFTERGLQSQLEVYLQPIVNRASAELVQTINAHLGEVLRAYVAEAIEREIEKWRHDTQ